MTELPLSLAVQLGIKRINERGSVFNPNETSLLMDFHMSSGLSGVAALVPEDGRGFNGYDLVKWSTAETPALDVTLDELWVCAKAHYGLTAATAIAGVGGVPISKLRLGYNVAPGSSKYTDLASHYGHKFFPMATLPHGSTAARGKKHVRHNPSLWNHRACIAFCGRGACHLRRYQHRHVCV